MSLLQKLTPLNLQEEKEKFMSDQTYNPQFIYSEDFSQKKLEKYGLPQQEYIELAKDIVDRSYFGRNEQDLLMMEGKLLTKKQVTERVEEFLRMHSLEDKISIIWSHSFVSRTTINSESIKMKLPPDYRKEGLIGMLYHEIGTHALRRVNYEQQPWFRRKKKYGFRSYLSTEEGLASLHSLIPKSFKLAHSPALRYITVQYNLEHSFAELWNFLGNYVQDFERRWMICVRQKRGITDTSRPGGFTKDLVYFQGLVDVFRWLKEHQYKLDHIYYGKMAMEDVKKAVEMNPNFLPALPSFYKLDTSQYASDIEKIGQENRLL